MEIISRLSSGSRVVNNNIRNYETYIDYLCHSKRRKIEVTRSLLRGHYYELEQMVDEQAIEKSDNLEFSLFLILDVAVCKLVFK